MILRFHDYPAGLVSMCCISWLVPFRQGTVSRRIPYLCIEQGAVLLTKFDQMHSDLRICLQTKKLLCTSC